VRRNANPRRVEVVKPMNDAELDGLADGTSRM